MAGQAVARLDSANHRPQPALEDKMRADFSDDTHVLGRREFDILSAGNQFWVQVFRIPDLYFHQEPTAGRSMQPRLIAVAAKILIIWNFCSHHGSPGNNII